MLREALRELDDPLIAYAVKANPNPAVLATLAREGLGGDIVSIGEYRRARAAGMPPERILFSGVGKTADEMAEALAGGLLQFNLESVEEARTLSAVASPRASARRSRSASIPTSRPAPTPRSPPAPPTTSSAFPPPTRSKPSASRATFPASRSPGSPSISAAS